MILRINNYLNKKIDKASQINNRKLIYDFLLKNVFLKPDFDLLNQKNIEETFNLFDNLYFNYNIQKYIGENKIKISFDTSEKLIKTAGKVCINKDYRTFKLVLSSTIIRNIFDKNINRKKLGGLICHDRLECYIILFEHEFIHLILGLTGLSKNETMHGPLFKKLIRNMFGQTEMTHNLFLDGDVFEVEKQVECLKNDIKIGNTITTKKISNKILKGKVIKINPKNVRIKLENGKIFNIKYEVIESLT